MDQPALETGRIHIFVTGRVQGVGFRAFVQRIGVELNLTGWVRNLGYHQVETVAEGNPQILKQFLEAVRTGPRNSLVDELNFDWEVPLGEYHSFQVRFG